jgi:hypothetical protein
MNLFEDLARPGVAQAGQAIVDTVKPEEKVEGIEAKIARARIKSRGLGDFEWFPNAIPWALGGFAAAYILGCFSKK